VVGGGSSGSSHSSRPKYPCSMDRAKGDETDEPAKEQTAMENEE
jgi:hypothetical protein